MTGLERGVSVGEVRPRCTSPQHPQDTVQDGLLARWRYKGMRLLGANVIDDDAVRTRETRLVEHGVLKTLLATRVPVRAVPHSTGSRRGWGPMPSNLFVTSEKASSADEIRKELLKLAKDRGLDYGIVVRHAGGGGAEASFTRMAARMAQQGEQGGNSLAEVYKLYPDGHEGAST